ncbi:MAG: sensor histidine kinase YesM [Saprospiraceae bacterium]|jgi:sensor histidine kinase YesM
MEIEQRLRFKLEYQQLKFPLRLLVSSILGIGATALVLGELPNDDALMIVLSSYSIIVLVLWSLLLLLNRLSVVNGAIFAWLLGAIVIVGVYWVSPIGDRLSVDFAQESSSMLKMASTFDNGYLWIMGLFVLPIALGYEQLISVKQELHDSEVKSAVSDLDFRIRPHFLFNSLNSVATLIHHDPVRAEDGLMALADMFRTIMTDKRKMVPLSSELSMAEKYIGLEKMRLGDRLQVKWSVNGLDGNALIPILTLQPLIENAIYHGIETRVRGGMVMIKGRQSQQYVFISIINPKSEVEKPVRKGNQIAQQNLIDRFEYLYGGNGSMQMVETDSFYTMMIKFPR